MENGSRRLFQRQHARDMSGGDFSDTVADNHVWLDPPGGPQRCQRHLNGKNRGLRERGFLQARIDLAR